MLTVKDWVTRFFPDHARIAGTRESVREAHRLAEAFEAAYTAGYAHGLAVAQDFAEAYEAMQEPLLSEDDDAPDTP